MMDDDRLDRELLDIALKAKAILGPIAHYPLTGRRADADRIVHATLFADPPVLARDTRPRWDQARWEDWRRRLNEANSSLFHGLRASQYHRDNIAQIEKQIIGLLRGHGDVFRRRNRSATTAFVVPVLGFEYAAYLFAERRTLEYLAVAVATFFGKQCHRIRKLDVAIADAPLCQQRDLILRRLREDLPSFGLDRTDGRSARDRIAHWEAVDAGVFNVVTCPPDHIRIALVGGGEELDPEWGSNVDGGITDAIDVRLGRVTEFVVNALADLGLLPHG
jgi:hypothetical protein